MEKFNISKPKKYLKDGQEKTYWQNVGTMTEFRKQDGSISRIIEIPAIGLEANIFPIEPRQNATQQARPVQAVSDEVINDIVPSFPSEDINPEDIPF